VSIPETQRVGAIHIIDTLAAAGAERVAVNIVNHLPRDKYVPYLCTTRSDGPFDALVASDVIRLRLQRKSRFDRAAVIRLRNFLRENNIRILHAHSSALFISRLAALGLDVKIVWHAHYGRYALEDQRAYRYRIATAGVEGAITVNKEMAEWCSRRLGMPSKRVWYLPNPVSLEGGDNSTTPTLPGSAGTRIICLANFRVEKDHLTLVRAMSRVVREVPGAHLLLAGKTNDQSYKEVVQTEISALGLDANISILGERHDVAAVLRACDLGVLSSVSEGLPMSLLEYGAAGLPAVATAVGQCPEVLNHGEAGILVPPLSIDGLAAALISLLRSPERRRAFGERFQSRVRELFSADAVMGQICAIYDTVLGNRCEQHPPVERGVLTSQPLS
jgi:glycosyltransferase involved in cell wall biosynthesis